MLRRKKRSDSAANIAAGLTSGPGHASAAVAGESTSPAPAEFLGLKPVATINVLAQPADGGTRGTMESWRLCGVPLPDGPAGLIPKMMVANPQGPGAAVIYGPLRPEDGNPFGNRQVLMVQPSLADGITSKVLTAGTIKGIALRPGAHPALLRWDEIMFYLRDLDGEDTSLGSFAMPAITSVIFHPTGRYLGVRRRSAGFAGFTLRQSRDSNAVVIEKLPGCIESRVPGPGGNFTYDAGGRHVFAVEGGQCFHLDLGRKPIVRVDFDSTEGGNPLCVATQPDPKRPAEVAFAGYGSHAYFIKPGNRAWKKRRIAQGEPEIGAVGLAWLNACVLAGWRQDRFFAVAAPLSVVEQAALGPKAPSADTFAPFGTWTPGVGHKIVGAQICREDRVILVFTAPIPQAPPSS